ncbi:hypothetical protein PvtlMGM2_2386 [Prevotella sp. MGM2]|nr:hypothetical protein PvtlMGM2_2386 [Prevotella sp. MGM2]
MAFPAFGVFKHTDYLYDNQAHAEKQCHERQEIKTEQEAEAVCQKAYQQKSPVLAYFGDGYSQLMGVNPLPSSFRCVYSVP